MDVHYVFAKGLHAFAADLHCHVHLLCDRLGGEYLGPNLGQGQCGCAWR